MAVFVVCLVLFLAMTGHSSASYCVCKDGLSEQAYQKDIDYACGAGADCSPILQNGPCFNPNTVKDHCNYAVNSYFQRKGQAPGSCDFSGSAVSSPTVPNMASGCVYPSSPSNTGGGTTTSPSTNPTTAPPGGSGTGIGTNPITTPTGPTTGTGTGFGLGPSGSGISNPDGSGSGAMTIHQDSYLLVITTLASVLGLIWLRF